MASTRKVPTTSKHLGEPQSGFDLYVAPPGRGVPQAPKGIRLEVDFIDAMERLVGYKDDKGRKVYPFKSVSDVMRSSLHIGFKYLLQLADSEELLETAAQHDALVKSQSAASRLLRTEELVKKNEEILTKLIQKGAREEAKSFYREQWKATGDFKGYQQESVRSGLERWREALFGEGAGEKEIAAGGLTKERIKGRMFRVKRG